ncbi:MAG: tetratricopeptide repeat protein [Spirochaetales bacterium]|nr:tetratricopeptide repeat protein [Spirochaetales bacterium]
MAYHADMSVVCLYQKSLMAAIVRCTLVILIVCVPVSPCCAKNKAVSLYEQGRIAQIQEAFYRAIELYKASLDINPDYVAPIKGLAECYYYLGEYQEALRYTGDAKKYDKTDLELYNLEGMIYTGLKEFDRARERFEYVLGKEPNNIEARFGLAEIDIANGKTREAAKRYLETLSFSPRNKVALLHLAALYEEMGEEDTALAYLELAVKYHSNEPDVHYIMGKHYLEFFNDKRAEYHLKTAIALKSGYNEAKQLLAIVYFKRNSLQEAIMLMRQTLASEDQDELHFARYCLGLFYAESGMYEEAINNYAAALGIRYDDEISRMAAEHYAFRHLGIQNTMRKNLARYHYNEGKLLEEKSYLTSALVEYRRSLRLDYDWETARYAYARIYKKMGFPIKYLMELKVLKDDYKTKNREVLDEYDLHLMNLYDSVSYRWLPELRAITGGIGISGEEDTKTLFDQYAVKQNSFSFALYTIPHKNRLIHPYGDRVMLGYLKDQLIRFRVVEVKNDGEAIDSFEAAFRGANELKSDFFIIVAFTERERSIEIVFTIYLTRIGSKLNEYNVYKTGNKRIQQALFAAADTIESSLPLNGTLLARKFNKGIIDLGTYHGIKKDDTLIIVKKGTLRLDHKDMVLVYTDDDVVGSFRVTATDEVISEGTIEKKGFFDFVNPEDAVIAEPAAE